MKKIKLTKGKFALVDDEDYFYLSRFNWQYSDNGKRAVRFININGQHVSFLMEYLILPLKKQEIFFHKNKNTLDNRKNNLIGVRYGIAKHSAKKMKTRSGKVLTSSYKGVSLSKRHKKFDARIYFNKQKYFLGRFNDEKSAAMAYNKKAKELYGEFAYQNKI